MTDTIFTGCSFTEGVGLENASQSPNLWVNILHNKVDGLKNTNLVNLGRGGATNDEIFYNTVNAIGSYKSKYIFVAWTSFNRYRLNPGVELYNTQLYFSPISELEAIDINPGIVYGKKFLNKFKNDFFMLQHDHYHYIKILNYSYTIKLLCDKLGITVFFINSLLPHDKDYFSTVTNSTRLPSDTTLYTQEEFCAETRSDEEFFKIYDKVHKDYKDTNGLECNWLNLYTGFRKCFHIDQGLDGIHPGVDSHQAFAKHLIEKLQGEGLK